MSWSFIILLNPGRKQLPTNLHISVHPIDLDIKYTDCIFCREVRPPLYPTSACPEYDTELHQMMKFQLLRFGECAVLLHCHYAQVQCDPEWEYLLRVPSAGQINLSKIQLYSIGPRLKKLLSNKCTKCK